MSKWEGISWSAWALALAAMLWAAAWIGVQRAEIQLETARLECRETVEK